MSLKGIHDTYIVMVFFLRKGKLTLLISLRLRTNYVIRVMRIKDKGDKDNFK